ncbi:MAG TPA: cation:proton antiporter [Paraburkholderia sp.]|uniref:cation:proton antiporter n=1 Tax=Paraburkholderia sp. TaxID=1926495 RepID=UPI002CD657E6|nr:cation:proton antiporter [Paraburkholderia sp.]HTR05906.1 cation:proton antiporter [Paraburkholderia sp.]
MTLIATFVALVFVYSLISRSLERTIITAPILFTALGALMSFSPEALNELALDRKDLLLIAELGLVMTLFTDASRVRPHMLKGETNLPVRLLSTGMLLTIALGVLAAMVVVRSLTWWEAGILAAILAPTDAGLGQAIVSSPRVPRRIRQALNVEAGLNDGLSVPFLMFFIALAEVRETAAGGSVLTRFLLEQLGYGTLVGVGVGLLGGWLLGLARRKEWMAEPFAQLGVVALPIGCVLLSEATGASMFIAAFVAGLAAQAGFSEVGKHSVEFTEDWGQLFNYFVFFLFGLFVTRVWTQFDFAIVAYAVLSLTLIRMVPVALALRGTHLSPASVLFMGWFGPRGLASIVLGLVYLEGETNLPGEPTIKLVVMATVLLSIFAHGLTALPAISRYTRAIATLGDSAPEHETAAADAADAADKASAGGV